MDVLSPFIFIFCHSDWLFHRESCPRLDVVYPGRAWSSSPAAYMHLVLFFALFLSSGNSLVSSRYDRSDGATDRAFDLRSIGRGFIFYSGKRCVTTLGKLFTPMCLCHQAVFNFIPAKRRWCSAAGKVTAGLSESNGSLPPGGWLTVTCGLTACTRYTGISCEPKARYRVWEA